MLVNFPIYLNRLVFVMSSLGAFQITKDAKFLDADNEDSDDLTVQKIKQFAKSTLEFNAL